MKKAFWSSGGTKVQQLLFSSHGAVKKFTASFLILLFALPPVNLVFAQEEPATSTEDVATIETKIPSEPIETPIDVAPPPQQDTEIMNRALMVGTRVFPLR